MVEGGQEFYSIAQVATKNKLSYGTVKRDIEKGKLPAYRIGRKFFIQQNDYNAYCTHHATLQQINGYTVREIMEIIPVSYGFLMDTIKKKELPAVKVGRQYMIERQDFDDFLARQKL